MRHDHDERQDALLELRTARRILEEGRDGASAEWLAAAEAYVQMCERRYQEGRARYGSGSGNGADMVPQPPQRGRLESGHAS